MTSGQFHSLPLSSITVDRATRQRREIDPAKLTELADSINRLGLIHPIVVTRDLALVAGERRFEACKRLGWTAIPAQYTDELSPEILRRIELEENIKRHDLAWQDECRSIEEYHRVRMADDSQWTAAKTAEALGLSETTISKKIAVARELNKGTARIIEAPKFSVAHGVVERSKQREAANAMEAVKAVIAPEGPRTEESIRNVDFHEWIEEYQGPRFNFIHCDFPYGIGADKFNQGAAPAHGGYADSKETYWSLISTLCRNLDRIALPSCHLVFWFSMNYYTETLDALQRNTNFSMEPFPLIWHKSDNVGILPDPERGPRRIYETAFFGSRGDRRIVSAVANSYAAPTVRERHMSEKPEPVLRHFFRMLVDEHTRLLDPTCGSGSALRAAESLGASHVLGLEVNEEFSGYAREALSRSRAARAA